VVSTENYGVTVTGAKSKSYSRSSLIALAQAVVGAEQAVVTKLPLDVTTLAALVTDLSRAATTANNEVESLATECSTNSIGVSAGVNSTHLVHASGYSFSRVLLFCLLPRHPRRITAHPKLPCCK
jgi:hypothetical protein